jgi:Crp-like helix-turn-helix domain
MSHGRVGADEFQLTQEFLAQVLGVRRPTVTAVPDILQEAGLIPYHRGRMTVLDRNGLEAASCECYEVVAKELDRLLGERREPADASPSHQVVDGATSPG